MAHRLTHGEQVRLHQTIIPPKAVPDSPLARRFLTDALAWQSSHDPAALEALLRSPCSGIPHDVAAAYATFARRGGSLLEAIEHERLALPADEREAVLRFAAKLRAIERLPSEDAAAIGEAIASAFLGTVRQPPSADTPVDPAPIELGAGEKREAGGGVRSRVAHFSASSLNAFAECERKWYYRYACGAIDDPGSSAATYGTAIHLALEDFHQEFARPSPGEETAMRARIVDDVRWAFERNRADFETPVEFELQVRRAQRTAQRYVDWLVERARTAPFEVIGRELPVRLEVNGHDLMGFVDRLDRDLRSGAVAVIDYKTGAIATSAAEYREKVRSFRDFQLPFYYWACSASGDKVAWLALVPLKDATLDVRPVVMEVVAGAAPVARRDAPSGSISIDELERAKRRMIALCDRIASGTLAYFAATRDPQACTYCAYALACTARPPATGSQFDR